MILNVDDEFLTPEELAQIETDTSTVIELAAMMLDEDSVECEQALHDKVWNIGLTDVPGTLAMAASMLATLAEDLAIHHECSPEEILMELRTWADSAQGEEEDE